MPHFTPASSSCLNLVVRWFAELTNRKLRRPDRRSVTGPETGIREWINERNKAPKPFVWTKSADEILETLAASCQHIIDSGHRSVPVFIGAKARKFFAAFSGKGWIIRK